MDIIDMAAEIILIAQQVFPVTPLPDSPLAPFYPAGRTHFAAGKLAGKTSLDQRPTGFVIRITIRQGSDTMEMVRQHHHSVDDKGMILPHLTHNPPQQIGPFDQQVIVPPLRAIDSKKIARPGNIRSSIICHPSPPTGYADMQ